MLVWYEVRHGSAAERDRTVDRVERSGVSVDRGGEGTPPQGILLTSV